MTINWKNEVSFGVILEIGNALFSNFGYAAITAAAALFKLAIAATLASYSAFLCATLVGGLVTYFSTRAILCVLNSLKLLTDNGLVGGIVIALNYALSPMLGAYILNLALGWALSLMPLLAVGSVGLVIGVAMIFTISACGFGNHSNQLSSAREGYRANALLAAPRLKEEDKNASELVLNVAIP